MEQAPKTAVAIQAAIQAARHAGREDVAKRLEEIAERLRASNDNAPRRG